jgi:hypothetical protein
MKYLLGAALALGLGTFSAQAASIDFTDSAFGTTFPASGDPASTASVAVDGVNFVVTAEARGTDGFRQSFDSAGLSFGLPGNGMFSISIVADTDVTYESFFGENRTQSGFSTPQLFNLLAGGSMVDTGLSFGTSFGTVDFADLFVAAGTAFVIDVDFTARSGYNSIYAQAILGSLDFSKAMAPIPLPAGLPLLLLGLGGLALVRKKRTS